MTDKCDHCPIADGPCLARMCDKAARGVASDLAQIRAVNATRSRQPTPPAYPSLLKQAGNLAKSAVGFVADGCATVDQAEFDRRKAICEDCEWYDPARRRCRECGCWTPAKLWMRKGSCRIGKHQAVE